MRGEEMGDVNDRQGNVEKCAMEVGEWKRTKSLRELSEAHQKNS